jgi:predicted ATP-grasp superfamily ATP-dependent carboligase
VAVGFSRGLFAPAALSRYCRASLEYPESTQNAAAFVEATRDFARAQSIDLMVPMTDWTTVPVSRFRDRFDGVCRLALPPHAALELANDKYRTIELARSLQVPAPETWLLQSIGDLDALPQLTYPIVVKDRSSARWLGNRAVFGSVGYVYSEKDLRLRVAERLKAAGDVLVQQFVGGRGIGFSCFAIDGEIFLPFQWLRVREVDPRGSGSSCRKSLAVDPEIVELSRRLITEVGFQGIAMVEFKQDPTSKRPVLMEINGRPWGSIQLPIAAGIDYPRHLVRWCLEGKLPPAQIAYAEGITCRRMVGDLTHLENLRRGTPRDWPIPYPNFWTSLARIAVPWYPGLRYDDLSFSDPRPGLAGIRRWFGDRLKRTRSAVSNQKRVARGIVHCHTTFSYDGKLSLSELCNLLRQEGFDFVGLTEHTQGLAAEHYAELVQACRENSDENFVAIPGLEFRCGDGLEIAGIGLPSWLEDKPPAETVAAIRAAGGFAIWVHPFKTGKREQAFLDCDAVEIMNGKEDGELAPNLPLLREYARQREAGRKFHAIFGLDFHNLRQHRNVWIECQVEQLTAPTILQALREGQFVSRVAHGAMSSKGKITATDHLKMTALRSAFVTWGAVLHNTPGFVRNSLLAASRPVVRVLKRRG